ncbi:MAG: hypothetical protein WC490_02360 [Candidatus Margulisiibacteriota bacterium]
MPGAIELRSRMDGILKSELPLRLNMARGRDVPLLCGDLIFPEEAPVYRQKFSPFIVDVYNRVLGGEISRFPRDFWTGAQGFANSIVCIDHGIRNILGLVMSEDPLLIDPRLFREGQGAFLAETVTAQDKNWQNLFMQIKLLGAVTRVPEHQQSCATAFFNTYPWAFDLNTEERNHLHPWDFIQRDMWRDEKGYEMGITAVRHGLERHAGLNMDEANCSIDSRLFPEPGSKFPERYTALPRVFGFSQWIDLFSELGLAGAMQGVPAFERKHSCALYHAYPWAFDLDTEEGSHLHFWDFVQVGLWESGLGQSLVEKSLRHVLESHLGLRMVPPGDRGPEQFYIDERLLKGRMDLFLAENGVSTWPDLINEHMMFLRAIREDLPDFPKDIAGVFQLLYPWAFDLSTPEDCHAHPWQVALEARWYSAVGEMDLNRIAAALRHEVDREGWDISRLAEKVTPLWLKESGLGGILDIFGRVVDLIKAVYADDYGSAAALEAGFRGLHDMAEDVRARTISSGVYYDQQIARVNIGGTLYTLPGEFAGMVAKMIGGNMIGVMRAVDVDGKKDLVLVATFEAAPRGARTAYIKGADLTRI